MSRGKKEKEPKRKKKGLWKMTPLWESKRRGFPQRFGKACWLFHISAQGPVADEPLTINQRRGSLLLDQGGSVLRCQNETAKRPLSEPPQSVGQQRTAKARKKLGSIGANHAMVEATTRSLGWCSTQRARRWRPADRLCSNGFPGRTAGLPLLPDCPY